MQAHPDQATKAAAFRAAHSAPFLIPNPWDAGSARLLSHLGFQALATTLVREVDRPVSVLVGFPGMHLSVDELFSLGVRRVSVGGSFARAAYGAFQRAAAELQERGTTAYVEAAASSSHLNTAFRQP